MQRLINIIYKTVDYSISGCWIPLKPRAGSSNRRHVDDITVDEVNVCGRSVSVWPFLMPFRRAGCICKAWHVLKQWLNIYFFSLFWSPPTCKVINHRENPIITPCRNGHIKEKKTSQFFMLSSYFCWIKYWFIVRKGRLKESLFQGNGNETA